MEIAINQGNAGATLGIRVGDIVTPIPNGQHFANSSVSLVAGVDVVCDGIAHNDALETEARGPERSATVPNQSG